MNSTPAPHETSGAEPCRGSRHTSRAATTLDGLFSWLRRLDLRRDQDHRWIGGVCSGIALRLGISPLLVRALAILLVVSGPGVMLYLVSWCLVPDLDDEIVLDQAYNDADALASALVIVTVLVSFAGLPWMFGAGVTGRISPMLGLAAAVWFGWSIIHRKDAGGRPVNSGEPAADGADTTPVTYPATVASATGQYGYGIPAPTAAERAQVRDERRSRREGEGRRRRGRRQQWIALLLLFVALAVPVQVIMWFGLGEPLQLTMWLSVALLGVGSCTALFLALRGRRVGVLMTAMLPFALLAGTFAHLSSLGYPTSGAWSPPTLTALPSTYRYGAAYGDADLDLTKVDLDAMPQAVEVDVRLTAGRLRVHVPDGVRVDLTARNHLGQTSIHSPDVTDVAAQVAPLGASDTHEVFGSGDKTITLHTEVGIGQIDVTTAGRN